LASSLGIRARPHRCGRSALVAQTGRLGGTDGQFIAKANIEHFKELLATEKNEAKRKVLLELLAGEELKLATAVQRKRH
jgi:hypothetical protein